MINFSVYIYDFDNASWVKQRSVFPFKFADLLDERLDEVEISLKAVKTDYFKPMQFIKVEMTNKPAGVFSQAQYDAIQARASRETTKTFTSGKITETWERYYIVANDNSLELVGVKTNAGLKTYNHELYGIEITKIMEGFIGDTITFTNPLGHTYVEEDNGTYVNILLYKHSANETSGDGFVLAHFSYAFPTYPLFEPGTILTSGTYSAQVVSSQRAGFSGIAEYYAYTVVKCIAGSSFATAAVGETVTAIYRV